MYEYIRIASTRSSRSAPSRARTFVSPGATPQPGTIRQPAATAASCRSSCSQRLRVVRAEVDEVDAGRDRGVGDGHVVAHVGRVEHDVGRRPGPPPATRDRRRRRWTTRSGAPSSPQQRGRGIGPDVADRHLVIGARRPDRRPPPIPSRPTRRGPGSGSSQRPAIEPDPLPAEPFRDGVPREQDQHLERDGQPGRRRRRPTARGWCRSASRPRTRPAARSRSRTARRRCPGTPRTAPS